MRYLMKRRLGLGNLLVAGLVVMSLTSCQEEEFYEKDSYETFTDIYERENPIGDENEVVLPIDDVAGNDNGSDDSNDASQDDGTGSDNGAGDNGSGDDGDDGQQTVSVSENFTQEAERSKLDVLWVIDNSGSMADEQAAIAYNFDVFIRDFIQEDIDFKMAITTTDTSSSSRAGKEVYGSMQALTSANAQSNEAQFLDDFASMIQVGTSGSGIEKGIYASAAFGYRYQDVFLRDDAQLVVIYVSDEEDQSSQAVSYYTDYLKSLKNSPSMLKSYSIVDMSGVDHQNRWHANGYARYEQANQQTGGYTADINSDFYTTLSNMGNSIVRLTESFSLNGNPIDGTIEIYVDGIQSSDWEYDSASRTIRFLDGFVPADGSEIVVNYSQLQ